MREYTFLSSSLSILDETDPIVPRVERIIGTSVRDSRFANMSEQQSELCLGEIIQYEDQAAKNRSSPFVFTQFFEISAWHTGGQCVATSSQIMMHYGQLPCISTFLRFDTVEQFQQIKQVFDELGLCKLNDKHLKPVKGGRAR